MSAWLSRICRKGELEGLGFCAARARCSGPANCSRSCRSRSYGKTTAHQEDTKAQEARKHESRERREVILPRKSFVFSCSRVCFVFSCLRHARWSVSRFTSIFIFCLAFAM